MAQTEIEISDDDVTPIKPDHTISKEYYDMYTDLDLVLTPLAGWNDERLAENLRGKQPVLPGWTRKKDTPDYKFFTGKNAGFVLTSRYLIIDIDPRNFPTGTDPVKQLSDDIGVDLTAIDTFVVRTGSGGTHIYLKKDHGLRVVNDLPEYPGVEFKSFGRQVVIPGSKHANGHLYEIDEFSLSIDQIAEAPEELTKLISRKNHIERADISLEALSQEFTDSFQTIARGMDFLKQCDPAIEGEMGDHHTFRIAATLRDMGISPKKCFNLMLRNWNNRCEPPWEQDDLKIKVHNAYTYAAMPFGYKNVHVQFDPEESNKINGVAILSPEAAKQQEEDMEIWKDNLDRNQYGAVKLCFKNICLVLQNHERLRDQLYYDEFAGCIRIRQPLIWHDAYERAHWPLRGKRWNDSDTLECKGWLTTIDTPLDTDRMKIDEAAELVARKTRVHPVREYLNTLVWDGKPRLDQLFIDYFRGADNDYTRAVGRKTLTAAVKRVFEPGCKFDYIPFVEGPQGIGKSTGFRILAGDDWFSDEAPDFSNKDAVMLMNNGILIWELPEALQLRRGASLEVQKAFISRRHDLIRLPYGRRISEFPRQCILIATTNDLRLYDNTGNRRFWPVHVGSVNVTKLIDDKDQLWAEAKYRYDSEEQLYMDTTETHSMARKAQEEELDTDEWEITIREWLYNDSVGMEFDKIRSMDIWVHCFGRNASTFERKSQVRIGSILHHRLKWERRTVWMDGKAQKGFVRP